MQDFEGKVAVVTGAASGMGRAFAERFAQEGMKVVLADVESAPLELAVLQLRQSEHDVIGIVTDVASPGIGGYPRSRNALCVRESARRLQQRRCGR